MSQPKQLLAQILAKRQQQKTAGLMGDVIGGAVNKVKKILPGGAGPVKPATTTNIKIKPGDMAGGAGPGKTLATMGAGAGLAAVGGGIATDKINPLDAAAAAGKGIKDTAIDTGRALVGAGDASAGPGMLDQGIDKVKEWGGKAVDWAKANPGMAIAGGGAAALLAYLLMRRRNRDEE